MMLLFVFCFSMTATSPALALPSEESDQWRYDAMQAAEVLGVSDQVRKLDELHKRGDKSSDDELTLRAQILRRILYGFLEVRKACNRTDVEIAYAFDVMEKDRRKVAFVNHLLTVLTFAQLSVLYTLEPRSRIHKQFVQSAIMTSVSAGVGTTLSIIGVLYNKFHRTGDLAPPKFMTYILKGGPVTGIGLSSVVDQYLDRNEMGSSTSRRQDMYALWKKRYGVDATNLANLCAINDGKKHNPGVLSKRLLLLWSLHTYIQDFDDDLLCLLQLIRSTDKDRSASANLASLGLNAGALEAAQLLKLEPEVEALVRLKEQNVFDQRRVLLETELLEGVLEGMLESRIASDRVDEEINYASDVVLGTLLARRGKGLQLNYEANFIQQGTFGATAGLLYLKKYTKAGNEMFVISGGVGLALTTLALIQMHGGWRKIDTPPNSLATILNLGDQYKFSPMMTQFLNNRAPDSPTGKSRKDHLMEIWKQNKVSTMNIDDPKNRDKLAAMPTVKRDTIKIVSNRIALLRSLKARMESFDNALFDLVEATQPAVSTRITTASADISKEGMGELAAETAQLINVMPQIDSLRSGASNQERLHLQTAITRRVLSTLLDLRKTIDNLDMEIARESQARERLVRNRDMAVSMTNNANFFQLGILSCIIDGPLGLSGSKLKDLYSNRLNIVSGMMVGGFALASVLEQPGGIRMQKTPPNMLGSFFNLSPQNQGISPLISSYLNSSSPIAQTSMTRKEELFNYWKHAKIVSANVNKRSTQEVLAASGPSHHFWSETIRTLTDRIYVLYDMRAIIDTMDEGLADLMKVAG